MSRLPVLGLLVAACANTAPGMPDAAPLEQIAGRRWVVESVEPARDSAASWGRVAADMTLDASTGTAGGNGGCNRWSAGFTSAAPGEIRFGDAAATMMACTTPGFMEREGEFFEALQAVTRWRLEGGRLLLLGPAGHRIVLGPPPP
jgi:heat shock protein HslJ